MLEGVEEKWGSGPASQALSTESHVAQGAAAWGSAREKEGIPIPPPPLALDKCEGAEACWGALSTAPYSLSLPLSFLSLSSEAWGRQRAA